MNEPFDLELSTTTGAPTSDLIAFHSATEQVLDCLFKDRFDAACARSGFRTPWAAYPASVEDARSLAHTFPYPALLKPRSHVGIGLARGEVVRDADALRCAYRLSRRPGTSPGQPRRRTHTGR